MTPHDTGLLSPVRAGTPAEEATSDTAWVQAMLDAEAALARAQARLGSVPAEAAAVITETAAAGPPDVRALALASRETANPVVGLVAAFTAAVAERDATAAEYVHRGSTSQDVFDTGALLVAARTLRLVRDDLRLVADALGRLAAAHRDTPAAARTLALQAVPTTFGLRAAGWRQLVLDAEERVGRLLDDGGLPVALGGAAGTLAGYLEYARLAGEPDLGSYPERLAALFAEETGLARPAAVPWHALRSPMADLAAVLSLTAGALGKFALDVQNLTRTEVGEVAEPAVAGRGSSSAMPHKRNPVLATMIRTAALQVPAFALVLTQQLLAEDERSAGTWHAEWLPLRECLRLVGGAARTAVELAEGLEARPARMRVNLGLTGGQMVSERVSAVLAPRLGKAGAKRLLTELSEESVRTGRPLADVLSADPRVAGVLTAEECVELCDPERYVGAAGAMVDAALTRGD
ncbi:adenylosuccinate lyase family protein [Streptomyces luteireticuli]|uniref:class-II fumarase/aspartase family protein n=1 Tax=Streptomyces luteireticuli TaxID=173858 RepID=UPI00355818C6